MKRKNLDLDKIFIIEYTVDKWNFIRWIILSGERNILIRFCDKEEVLKVMKNIILFLHQKKLCELSSPQFPYQPTVSDHKICFFVCFCPPRLFFYFTDCFPKYHNVKKKVRIHKEKMAALKMKYEVTIQFHFYQNLFVYFLNLIFPINKFRPTFFSSDKAVSETRQDICFILFFINFLYIFHQIKKSYSKL